MDIIHRARRSPLLSPPSHPFSLDLILLRDTLQPRQHFTQDVFFFSSEILNRHTFFTSIDQVLLDLLSDVPQLNVHILVEVFPSEVPDRYATQVENVVAWLAATELGGSVCSWASQRAGTGGRAKEVQHTLDVPFEFTNVGHDDGRFEMVKDVVLINAW